MVAENGSMEASESAVRRYFGSGKGAAQRWESGRRGEGGGGGEVAKSEAESDGPRYDGTDKCDARVGE